MYAGTLSLGSTGLADSSPGQGWAPSEIWVHVAILTHCFRGVGKGEASEKAERGGGWIFGERFDCASGFPHTGSGRPEEGVGEGCAGTAIYPLHADLEVGR